MPDTAEQIIYNRLAAAPTFHPASVSLFLPDWGLEPGDVVTVNSTRCIVQGGDKTIAMVGLEDTIIVDTKDALLVCAKDSAGDIRKVLEVLRAVNRTELL